ncbi:sigma-70 family RNA polymerase sigma factor [Kitasatospora sp. NPDC057936]|uniref:sigma-70 family RNA polymerase sigma factor n=1 Tax=Kitasatospora sp. NPDC057936 TaxID=3346283 RepID=UPI0036D7D423
MTLCTQQRPDVQPLPWINDVAPEELCRLVVAVAGGSEEAFARLYDAVAGPVYGTAVRTLRNPAHAEEVAQEVLLEVWRGAAGYRPERGTVMAWVLTIARRRAVDRVRSVQAASDRETRVASLEPPVGESVVDLVERGLDVERVRAALAGLSRVQRESLVLAYYGGYSQREIAQMLRVPLGTVKTRMRDGLIRLRASFATGPAVGLR